MVMKKLADLLILFVAAAACSISSDESSTENGAAFVTYLGNDTLAVEEFSQDGNEFTARVVLRSPRTTLSSYSLSLNDAGGMESMTRTDYPLDVGFEGEGSVVQRATKQGDSLMVEFQTDDGMQTFTMEYDSTALPFIDMLHWPYELALSRAAETGQDTLNQPLLTGSRFSDFIIAEIDADSMTIRHPFRGVMAVDVDQNGHLEMLDAGATTRKLKVHRQPSVDFENIAQRFASADQRGNPFGELSGAESAEFSFGNTNFRVEYGSPQKRGRDLFGGIVPWGERWRTGANEATHFYTSGDLQFGDLSVPAGEYTLFTIPEQDGGTLIINRETGQNGRSYDESRDLGRVPMEISQQQDTTEAFTIRIEESEDGGVLKLIWGQTVFSADFQIQ